MRHASSVKHLFSVSSEKKPQIKPHSNDDERHRHQFAYRAMCPTRPSILIKATCTRIFDYESFSIDVSSNQILSSSAIASSGKYGQGGVDFFISDTVNFVRAFFYRADENEATEGQQSTMCILIIIFRLAPYVDPYLVRRAAVVFCHFL